MSDLIYEFFLFYVIHRKFWTVMFLKGFRLIASYLPKYGGGGEDRM